MTGQERRRYPRVTVDVPIRIFEDGIEFSGLLRDICREAALVETSRAWPLDTEISLRMELPGITEVIEARGKVIRLVHNEVGTTGMAVLFTDITPISGLRIDFFIALQTDLHTAGGGDSQPT